MAKPSVRPLFGRQIYMKSCQSGAWIGSVAASNMWVAWNVAGNDPILCQFGILKMFWSILDR